MKKSKIIPDMTYALESIAVDIRRAQLQFELDNPLEMHHRLSTAIRGVQLLLRIKFDHCLDWEHVETEAEKAEERLVEINKDKGKAKL